MNSYYFFTILYFFSLILASFCAFLYGGVIENIIAVMVIAASSILIYFKPKFWVSNFIVLLVASTGGPFLELKGISINTFVLFFSLLIYFIFNFKKTADGLKIFDKNALIFILLIILIGSYSTIVALIMRPEDIKFIFSDLIPFAYILLYFPIVQIIKQCQSKYEQAEFIKKIVTTIFIVFVGQIIFSSILFFLFSAKIVILQDTFYDWLRQKLAGKITYLGFDTFRIVFPVFFLLASSVVIEKFQKRWVFPIAIMNALSISRGIMLAQFVAIFSSAIFNFKNLKTVLKTIFWLSVITLGSLFILNFSASKGESFGINNFIGRGIAVFQNQGDVSIISRKNLLVPIWNSTKLNPILGNGIGYYVKYVDAGFKGGVTTRQFDWGYLEFVAESGFIGLAILILAFYYLYKILSNDFKLNNKDTILVSLAFYLVFANITFQAFFHIFGILIFTIILIASTIRQQKQYD